MEFNELEEIVLEQRTEFEKKDSGLERIYDLMCI